VPHLDRVLSEVLRAFNKTHCREGGPAAKPTAAVAVPAGPRLGHPGPPPDIFLGGGQAGPGLAQGRPRPTVASAGDEEPSRREQAGLYHDPVRAGILRGKGNTQQGDFGFRISNFGISNLRSDLRMGSGAAKGRGQGEGKRARDGRLFAHRRLPCRRPSAAVLAASARSPATYRTTGGTAYSMMRTDRAGAGVR
jgi:hypothetical protein